MMNLKSLCLAVAVGLAYVPVAGAAVFSISGQLTGDIRAANPDGLFVDVTIDVNGNTALWTVDINSPLHASIKLDEFYFNLVGPASRYQFSNYDPTGWLVSSPATVQGAGGTTFLFETLDPPGLPNAADVTNTQNLTFTMTYLGVGELTANDFLLATTALSNDAGSGQMGAHLQSLTLGNPDDPATSDSGFAFGNYVGGCPQGAPGTFPDCFPQQEIPEPGSLALLGLGLAGLSMLRRRRV